MAKRATKVLKDQAYWEGRPLNLTKSGRYKDPEERKFWRGQAKKARAAAHFEAYNKMAEKALTVGAVAVGVGIVGSIVHALVKGK